MTVDSDSRTMLMFPKKIIIKLKRILIIRASVYTYINRNFFVNFWVTIFNEKLSF